MSFRSFSTYNAQVDCSGTRVFLENQVMTDFNRGRIRI